MAKKKPHTIYSDEDRHMAMLRVQENEFRFTFTARELGINVNTLKQWDKKYPEYRENFEKELERQKKEAAEKGGPVAETEIIKERSMTEYQDERNDFIAKCYEAQKVGIEKLKNQLQYETKVHNIVQALEFLKSITMPAISGDSQEHRNVNYYTQVNNLIKKSQENETEHTLPWNKQK
jgi:hypothetical protein